MTYYGQSFARPQTRAVDDIPYGVVREDDSDRSMGGVRLLALGVPPREAPPTMGLLDFFVPLGGSDADRDVPALFDLIESVA